MHHFWWSFLNKFLWKQCSSLQFIHFAVFIAMDKLWRAWKLSPLQLQAHSKHLKLTPNVMGLNHSFYRKHKEFLHASKSDVQKRHNTGKALKQTDTATLKARNLNTNDHMNTTEKLQNFDPMVQPLPLDVHDPMNIADTSSSGNGNRDKFENSGRKRTHWMENQKSCLT